jgi:hypothetical protein
MADRNVKVVRCNTSKPILDRRLKTASQAFDKNSLVEFASGVINPSDSTDVTIYGIIQEEVATTDSDYATTGANGGKIVQVLGPGDEVEINFTGGAAVVGTAYGIDSAYNVDVTNTTQKVATVTADLAGGATSGRCRVVFKTYLGSNNL